MGCWSSPAPLGRREATRNHAPNGPPEPPLESPERRSRGAAAPLQRSPADQRSSEPTGSVDKRRSFTRAFARSGAFYHRSVPSSARPLAPFPLHLKSSWGKGTHHANLLSLDDSLLIARLFLRLRPSRSSTGHSSAQGHRKDVAQWAQRRLDSNSGADRLAQRSRAGQERVRAFF